MQLQKIILATNNARQLENFYRDILQLPVLSDDTKITIQAGQSELVFSGTGIGQPFYHFAFTIPANKIEEAKNWLEDKVKTLWIEDYQGDIAEFVNWHARSLYFFDPAGNIVELIARADLHNETDTPFSSSQILGISEIGLVFNEKELDEQVHRLLEDFQLSYFDKQPPLPQFKAVGDDEGLFVIVTSHRNWYPTVIPSGIFPIEVFFTNKGGHYHLQLPAQIVH